MGVETPCDFKKRRPGLQREEAGRGVSPRRRDVEAP